MAEQKPSDIRNVPPPPRIGMQSRDLDETILRRASPWAWATRIGSVMVVLVVAALLLRPYLSSDAARNVPRYPPVVPTFTPNIETPTTQINSLATSQT